MVGIRRFTSEELEYECFSKIKILEELVNSAKSKAVGSKAREEYATVIAVVLRTLTCKTSGTEGLIMQSGLDKHMLFPLYNPNEAFNILMSYHLVNIIHKDNQTSLVVRDDLKDEEKVYLSYLTYNAWLYEAVVDFKDQDFPPLSRYEIIRLLADKKGAHFDPDLDGRLYKITHEALIPVLFDGGMSSDNLFTETIIGIADELSFAFWHMIDEQPEKVGQDGFMYIQEYKIQPKSSYKFIRTGIRINAYNANQYFDCNVTEKEATIFRMPFRERYFKVAIFDIEV